MFQEYANRLTDPLSTCKMSAVLSIPALFGQYALHIKVYVVCYSLLGTLSKQCADHTTTNYHQDADMIKLSQHANMNFVVACQPCQSTVNLRRQTIKYTQRRLSITTKLFWIILSIKVISIEMLRTQNIIHTITQKS